MTARRAYLGNDQPPDTDTLERFTPKSSEELQRAVLDGRFDFVRVENLRTLLAAMMDGDIRIDQWAARGVIVELPKDGTATPCRWEEPGMLMLIVVQAGVTEWRTVCRRRRVIAGCILSVVAIGCAAALMALGAR